MIPALSRWRLRTQLVVILALSSLAPTALLGALAIRNANRNVRDEVTRGNLALIRAIGQQLNATLQDTRRALVVAAASWAADTAGGRPEPPGDAARMRRVLRRLRDEFSVIRSVTILDMRGARLGGDPAPAFPLDLANSYGGYVSEVLFGERSREVLIVVQARDRHGALVGFFAATIDLAFVARHLNEARLGPAASLLVVDGNGRLVATSTPRRDGEQPQLAGLEGGGRLRSLRDAHPAVDRLLATHTEGGVEFTDSRGRRYISVFRNIAGMSEFRAVRWGVVLSQPRDEAFALARQTTRDTLLVAGAVLLFALGAGVWVARRFARPVVGLIAQTDRVAEGNLDPPPTLSGGNAEVEVLAQRFAQMVDRLRENKRLEEQLIRSERLSSVGMLAAGVAHEVNNPLTTILGYAKLLLEGRAADDADRAPLELIAEEAARVQGIVRALLDFSRQDGGAPAEVSLNDVLSRVLALAQLDLRKRAVQVVTALADPLPTVLADERRLEQVFLNLVTNGAQAMPAGGELSLRTGADARWVFAEIVDRGEGIAPADLPRIFDPFFTTKGPHEGTGLGLAVSLQIIEAFGGTIEAESEPGTGSAFRVRLPRSSTLP